MFQRFGGAPGSVSGPTAWVDGSQALLLLGVLRPGLVASSPLDISLRILPICLPNFGLQSLAFPPRTKAPPSGLIRQTIQFCVFFSNESCCGFVFSLLPGVKRKSVVRHLRVEAYTNTAARNEHLRFSSASLSERG